MLLQRNWQNVCPESNSFRQRVFLLFEAKLCEYHLIGPPERNKIQSFLFRHDKINLLTGNGVFTLPQFGRNIILKLRGNLID